MRVAINKTTVEIGESKKNLNIGDRTGNWPIGDGGYASGIHGNTFQRDDKSQEADFLDMEFAFFEFDKQAMSEEFFENKADMLDMLFKSI